jgi:tetratricopeptide (TPR) repeat protein
MMTYLALLALVAVAALLFKARGVIAVILCKSKMQAGDYDGALRTVRWVSLGVPNPLLLHREALTLSFADRPAEAERCYRKALGMVQSHSAYQWERLYASLGFALIDLARYDEAEQSFHRAIEMGDLTGNSQNGLAELRLVQGVETEKALDYASQAIEHAKRRPDKRVPEAYHAHRAWALALVGRNDAARYALSEALRVPKRGSFASVFGIAEEHWLAGMALLAMQQPEEAREHFQIGHDADPRGKYGRCCGEHLG